MQTTDRRRFAHAAVALVLGLVATTLAAVPEQDLEPYLDRAARAGTRDEWWSYGMAAREHTLRFSRLSQQAQENLEADLDAYLHEAFRSWRDSREARSQPGRDSLRLFDVLRRIEGLDADADSGELAAIWDHARSHAPALETVIELESARAASRRAYDHDSLRRITERNAPLETASYLNAPWLFDQGLFDSTSFRARPEVFDTSDDTAFTEHGTYAETVAAAQQLWSEAEATLLAEHLRWEEATHTAYERERASWQSAFSRFSRQQQAWEQSFRELLSNERAWHAQQRDAFEEQRAVAAEAQARAIRARRSAADDRLNAAVSLYRASRAAERTARTAAELWTSLDRPEAEAEREYWEREAERNAGIAADTVRAMEAFVGEYRGDAGHGPGTRERARAEYEINRAEEDLEVWQYVRDYARTETSARETAGETASNLRNASQAAVEASATVRELSGELRVHTDRIAALRAEQQSFADAVRDLDLEIAGLSERQRSLLGRLDAPDDQLLEDLAADALAAWNNFTGGGQSIDEADALIEILIGVMAQEHEAERLLYYGQRREAINEFSRAVFDQLPAESAYDASRAFDAGDTGTAIGHIQAGAHPGSAVYLLSEAASDHSHAALVLHDMISASMLQVDVFADALNPDVGEADSGRPDSNPDAYARLELQRIRSQLSLELERALYVEDPEAHASSLSVEAAVLLHGSAAVEAAEYASEDLLRVTAWLDELLDRPPDDAAPAAASDTLRDALSRMEREDPAIVRAISSPSVARELSAHTVAGWREAHARTSALSASMRYDYLEQYVLTRERIDSARELASRLPEPEERADFLSAGLHQQLDAAIDAVPVLQEQYLRTTQALLEVDVSSDETLRVYRRERAVLHGMLSELQPYEVGAVPEGSPEELYTAAEDLLERSAEGYAGQVALRSEYERLYAGLMLRRAQVQDAQQHDPEEAAAELHEMNQRMEQIREERAEVVRRWEQQLEQLSREIRVLETAQTSLEHALVEEEEARHAYTLARSVDVYARSFSLTPEDVEARYDQAVDALVAARAQLEEQNAVERDGQHLSDYTDLVTGRLEAEYLLRELHEATRDIHEHTEELSREMQVVRDSVFLRSEGDASNGRHEWLLAVADVLRDDGSALFSRFSLAMYAETYQDYQAGRVDSDSGFMTPEHIVSAVLHDALTRDGAFRSPTDLGAFVLEQGQAARDQIDQDQQLSALYDAYRTYREQESFQQNHQLSEIEYLSAPAAIVAHAMERSGELGRRNRRSSRRLTAIGMGYYFSGLASFFSPPLMAALMLRSTLELSLAASAGRAAEGYEQLHDDLSALDFAREEREGLSDLEVELRAYASLASRYAELDSRREALTRGELNELPRLLASHPATRGGAESVAASLLHRIAGNERIHASSGTQDLVSALQSMSMAFGRDEDAAADAIADADPVGLKRALVDAYERFPQQLPFHHQSLSDERITHLHEYHRRRLEDRDEYDRAVFLERTEFIREGLADAARQRHAQLRGVEERGRQAWQQAGDDLVSRYSEALTARARAYERTAAEYEQRHEDLQQLHQRWLREAEGHESPDRLARGILSAAVRPAVPSRLERGDGALNELVEALSPARNLSHELRAARESFSLHEAAASRDHEAIFHRDSIAVSRPFASVSNVEILRHVQHARSRGNEETARRLGLAHAGRVISQLNDIRHEATHAVASANASIAESIHRTFTRAGFRRESDAFVRETLVGNTMQGSLRERHRIRGYTAFSDYRFDLPSGTSLHSLAALGSTAVSERVAAAQASVAAELERVFGSDAQRSGGGRVDPNAVMEMRLSLERGWLAELVGYGDAEEVIRREGSAKLMPGAFGTHVGYAPQLLPRVDKALGWRGNVAFSGRGELHELYGPFMYYQSLQGLGYGELQQGFHNARLWNGENAFSISDVLQVGAGVAGGFMSAGASIALNLGTNTLTSALDVVSGETDASQAALRSLKDAASVGIGSLGGLAGSRITGALGRGVSGQLASTAGELALTTTGRSAVYAIDTDGFSTERFLQGIAGPRTIAHAAGSISGSLLAGELSGFSAVHRASANAVAGAMGSAVEFGLEHGLTGSATLNVLNFADLKRLAGIQGYRPGASAGLVELRLGGDSSGIRLGSGGINASASRVQDLVSGLPVYAEQLRIAAHRLSGKTGFAPDYDGTRSVGTALRTLYSFGSDEGGQLYSDVLSGAVKLSVGTVAGTDAGTLVAERVRDATEDIVHLASLGDKGVNPAARASRLFAGLALEHEAHRDGRRSSRELQVAETVNAVRSRLDMADRMMADYGVELAHHELTVSELLLFRMAEELGDAGYFNDFVELVYGTDRDYFFLPVLTGGETQTSENYANVALLSGYSREEVERLNRESLDNAWESYASGQVYEHLYSSREAFGEALRADPDLAARYGYTHRNFISIRDYGCVLFSMAYMLRTATEEYHSVLDINAALVEQGLFMNRTLLSSDLIADALNLLSGEDIEFELVSRIARPTEDHFLDAHYSEEEYMGLIRIAAASHVGSDTRDAHGIHSEALRSLNLEWDETGDRYRVRSVNTANPYTGSYAHSARTERELDEFSRLDLFRVVRHASAERIPVVHHAYRSATTRVSAH